MGRTGRIILVGAGPGDPGLMTLAGKAALGRADVVLHDRLVGPEILAMIPSSAVTVDVGKNKGNHPTPQAEINRLLVRRAREGKTVVRLKGGDPFLFGRGAEELDAAIAAGIPFFVVPGVSSALAVPARAGIPVTHRGHSSSVHILAGHGRDGGEPAIPYDQLVGLGGTMVFLMALSAAEKLCCGLVAAGLPPDTPAAIIENGTRAGQRRLVSTVGDLSALIGGNAVSSPALLVVGEVCSLAEHYDWMAGLPLGGRNILVTGSRETGGRLAEGLRELGCGADAFAGIAMEPLPIPDAVWAGLAGYDWILLASRFGVDTFFGALRNRRMDLRAFAGVKFAAVGRRTAEALADHGVFADYVPDAYNGGRMAEGLSGIIRPGERALFFRARDGGTEAADILRAAGMVCDEVSAYRTARNPLPPELKTGVIAGRYDALAFTSSSAVEAFSASFGDGDLSGMIAFCIGAATAEAAKKFGMHPRISREATIESMIDSIAECQARRCVPLVICNRRSPR